MNNSIKVLFVLLFAFSIAACKKQEVYDPFAMLEIEAPILKEYVENTPELEGAILHAETGIWYKILQDGVGVEDEGYYEYNINNIPQVEMPNITAKYEGKYVATGVVFDDSDNFTFSLGRVISGWRIAFLPKEITDKKEEVVKVGGLTDLGLQAGAKIRLVIPSPYAYANDPSSGITINSPLDFTIEVKEVKPPPASKPVQ